mmetsp:Transcript_11603/g.32693  ORF Transcript_11603/g.32693 Transcript_11603/m.32693 type:complete len:341 (+) Transcript_11603:79-1101(+)
MNSSADVGGYSAPPPPVGNVGCYKGVMLCNRPPDDPHRPGAGEATFQPPFKSTIAATQREQVGLPPAKDGKKVEHPSGVKTRGPSAALRRHCQWIRELQEQVREDQRQAEEGEKVQQERKQRMAEVFKMQRDAIRQIKKERNRDSIQPHEIEAIIKPKEVSRPPRGAQKPLWAMTEEEKEGVEDEEADDLIRFAEGVDFDEYINDLEFRQGLEALKDRAKKIQREQDAFKDSILREFNGSEDDADEARSASAYDDARTDGGADRPTGRRPGQDSAPRGRPDWDASTAAGDDGPALDRESQAAADRVLQANPQLRGVHSKGSVRKLIERASEQGSVLSGSC